MRVTKIIGFVSLVLIAAVFVQKAHAILPYSTYGDDNGWQGSVFYNEDDLNLLIHFNVYDNWTYDDFDWEGEAELDLDDQYIYAYQIVSHPIASTEDIDYFGILNLDGGLIPQSAMHSTTTQPDELGLGISPDPCTSVVQGAWEWAQENLLEATGFSTLLIFSSPNPPTPGTFEVKIAEEEENPFPVPGVPEPTMVALLGAGAAMILRKGRRQDRIRYTARKNRTQGKC